FLFLTPFSLLSTIPPTIIEDKKRRAKVCTYLRYLLLLPLQSFRSAPLIALQPATAEFWYVSFPPPRSKKVRRVRVLSASQPCFPTTKNTEANIYLAGEKASQDRKEILLFSISLSLS